jgi:hypothetical protein
MVVALSMLGVIVAAGVACLAIIGLGIVIEKTRPILKKSKLVKSTALALSVLVDVYLAGLYYNHYAVLNPSMDQASARVMAVAVLIMAPIAAAVVGVICWVAGMIALHEMKIKSRIVRTKT